MCTVVNSANRSKMDRSSFGHLSLVVTSLMLYLVSDIFAARESTAANVGEEVTLSCEVTFHLSRSAHVAWKLGDLVIDNGGRWSINVTDKSSHLTVRGVTLQDSGNYTCEVRQSSVSSCEFYISVIAPPTTIVLTDATKRIFYDGEKLGKDIDELFSLSCCTGEGGSYPKTQIEWLFREALVSVEMLRSVTYDENDRRITHSCSNTTLLAMEEYKGWITCAAFHEGLRRPLYTSIKFETTGFTVLLLQDDYQGTVSNGSVVYLSESKPYSLTCQLEGCSRNVTLSWYLDNQLVTKNELIDAPIRLEKEDTLQSTATIVSPGVTLQGKRLKCEAVCEFLVKEVFVNLGVHSLPEVVMGGRPLIEFQPTSIFCMLNESLQDHVYRWSIDGEDVTQNATQRLTEAGNSWMSMLSFLPLKEHNGKLLSCYLGNDPTRFTSVEMNVLYGAVISDIQVFPSKIVDENSVVNITCDVHSNPIHENVVQWEKFVNGNSRRWVRIRHPSVVLLKNITWYRWVLQFMNVKKTDEGLYRCTATNDIGKFVESDSVHLQLNEMGICLDNSLQFIENEPATIRCLIKRQTPISIIRWLINNEEDVTRNATSKDIIDDRGRTVTESELQFYPLRKYNGNNLTCTAGMDEQSGDTIVLNISYCPDKVIFSKCESEDNTDAILLKCESGMSNPPTDLSLENSGVDETTEVFITKTNRFKYTGYISSLNISTSFHNTHGVPVNITCCSATNRCTEVCDVCVSKGTQRQANFIFILVCISISAFLLAASIVMFKLYRFYRHNIQGDIVELPESRNSGGTRIDNRSLPQQDTGPEYANSSSSSSEAIYEHMKERTTYVNESGGGVNIPRKATSTMWNCLLGYQTPDTNATETFNSGDTYNIPLTSEEIIKDTNSPAYRCDVITFTGLYQKHVPTMYTTEVTQPVRCDLRMEKEISKSDSYSFNIALISRGNIHMKVIVKILSVDASKCAKRLFVEETRSLEILDNHENVMQILGFCTTSTPNCIIFEFIGETLHVSLKAMLHSGEYQIKESDIKIQSCLKQFSYDVANGLEYLTRKDFTYPHLTCRNIFVDDFKHCKLHDFTLRELHVSNLSTKQEERHMQIAPEFTQCGEFSDKSDVWNYGHLLLQIYSFDGLMPHQSIEISEALRQLENFKLCPNNIHHLVTSCCNQAPDNRPCFKKILEDLAGLEKH